MTDIEKYKDILHLPHHVSPTQKRMSMAERAAQFSPFAALVGYEGAIRETGRLTNRKLELSEDEKAVLDRKQQIILAALERGEQPEVTVTYFRPDRRKDGGEYVTFSGRVRKIDAVEGSFVFTTGPAIPFDGVADLNSALFQGHFDS